MKTKLTLTVRQEIIRKARRYSKKSGKSISRIFEEFFESSDEGSIKSEPQRAAERLLSLLKGSPNIKTLNDKNLLKDHVARKYA